jgi:hypothetical protein
VTAPEHFHNVALRRPPALRAFLEAGGDLSTFPYLDLLVEGVCSRRRHHSVGERHRWASWLRVEAEAWLEGRLVDNRPWRRQPPDQAQVTLFFWEAELLDDDDLYRRLVACVPEQIAEQERRLAQARRPYCLEVARRDAFACQCCGGEFVDAHAVVLFAPGERPLELAVFCVGCIAATAAHAALVDG